MALNEIVGKIKSTFKLYGLMPTLLRVLKSVIYRLTSFKWEKCYLMIRKLDEDISLQDNGRVIKTLSLSDYGQPWRDDYLTESRYELYGKRFMRNDAQAVGAFVNSKLAYSTWILYDGVEINGIIYEKKGAGMLWDSYCLPQYRGMGLHNLMNAYSLNLMKEKGMKYGCVVVLAHNSPAIKTQKKCGLEIDKTFYTYKFLGKKYCSYKITK